jgi:hypothetical protein
MSRKWKSLPTHLPGWEGYRTRFDASKRKLKPNRHRPRRNRSRLRKHRPYPAEPIPQPRKAPGFTIPKTRITFKLLRIFSSIASHDSTWRCLRGHWHCVQADPPIEWFTRVNHPKVVEQWLRQNHFSWQWLAADKIQPESKPAEAYPPSQASVPSGNNTQGFVNHNMSQTLRPEVQVTAMLERNGVTTSSPLNTPGCPGRD